MTVKLNFINRTNEAQGAQFVVFQKNVASSNDNTAVAWQVIQYCAPGDNHPFTVPNAVSVSASDAYGNHMPQMAAKYGQAFAVERISTGDVLHINGDSASSEEVTIKNKLPNGAVDAYAYKDGKMLARKDGLAPGQKAVFEFKPTIWIGAVSQVEEGDVMNSAILQSINTEISLLGIKSADIVATGGGSGASAKPIQFSLENVVTEN